MVYLDFYTNLEPCPVYFIWIKLHKSKELFTKFKIGHVIRSSQYNSANQTVGLV